MDRRTVATRDAYLDATGSREVAYCHACNHNWWKDEGGIAQCPNCGGEAVEIIEPDNDPRSTNEGRQSRSPSRDASRHYFYGADSEDEDDDDHMGHNGLFLRRSTRGAGDNPHDPNVDPLMRRFTEMVAGFGPVPSRSPPGPRPGDDEEDFPMRWEDLTMRREENRHPFRHPPSRGDWDAPDQDDPYPEAPPPPHQTSSFGRIGGSQVHRTTFRTGGLGGGTASVTIVSSGPMLGRGGRGGPNTPGPDPFAALFSDILQGLGPPATEREGGNGRSPPGFAHGLQQLFNMLGHQPVGDAVYSQEALDRIISNLMEAHPQSNAAPPATEEAMSKLEKKPINKEMMGGESTVECSICIDDMSEGDMAMFLPCKHWFHEKCVTLWLKEHNTCPICRTPIDKPAEGQNNGGPASGRSSSRPDIRSTQSHNSNLGSPPETMEPPFQAFMTPEDPFSGIRGQDWFSRSPPSPPDPRPDVGQRPSDSNNTWEEFRSGSRPARLGNVLARATGQAPPSGGAYDTSRLQRRTSLSPTSPRQTSTAEQGARMRQRSPSQSSRRDAESYSESNRSSGHGPISWLRDHFSGGGAGRNGRRY